LLGAIWILKLCKNLVGLSRHLNSCKVKLTLSQEGTSLSISNASLSNITSSAELSHQGTAQHLHEGPLAGHQLGHEHALPLLDRAGALAQEPAQAPHGVGPSQLQGRAWELSSVAAQLSHQGAAQHLHEGPFAAHQLGHEHAAPLLDRAVALAQEPAQAPHGVGPSQLQGRAWELPSVAVQSGMTGFHQAGHLAEAAHTYVSTWVEPTAAAALQPGTGDPNIVVEVQQPLAQSGLGAGTAHKPGVLSQQGEGDGDQSTSSTTEVPIRTEEFTSCR